MSRHTIPALVATDRIWTVQSKKEESFLKTPTRPFLFEEASRREIQETISLMRRLMRAAHGVGLSANQAGLPFRFFIAEVPDSQGRLKFYALFNPSLEKVSRDKKLMEEGCLSVPYVYGQVERHARLTLKAQDKNGKWLKIKAWGLLAQVFQHEIGHLNGQLFIDHAHKTYEIPTSERLQKRPDSKAKEDQKKD